MYRLKKQNFDIKIWDLIMDEEESKVKRINVLGETCPVPLVEVRKAIRKASEGEIIDITGDHSSSKKEIPMAIEEMNHEMLGVEEENGKWRIRIQIRGEEE